MEQAGSQTGGNTKPQSSNKDKRVSASKHWCFTWNNYTDENMEQMEQAFQKGSMRYVIGKEVGEEGTPHLQGYVTAATKFRWSSLDLPKTIHWEKCKGSEKDNIKYCMKDGEFTMHGLKAPRQLKLITPSYPWEQEILEIIAKEPDDRTIYWYWSREGNIGKTCFCKYLTVKHGAMPLAGRGADVRNGIVEYTKKNGETPELCVFPIPRSYDTMYLSYEALENIKDMYFYSGKYEGAAICGPSPHLFVFANERPDLDKCSADRWHVVEIEKSEEDHVRSACGPPNAAPPGGCPPQGVTPAEG